MSAVFAYIALGILVAVLIRIGYAFATGEASRRPAPLYLTVMNAAAFILLAASWAVR